MNLPSLNDRQRAFLLALDDLTWRADADGRVREPTAHRVAAVSGVGHAPFRGATATMYALADRDLALIRYHPSAYRFTITDAGHVRAVRLRGEM